MLLHYYYYYYYYLLALHLACSAFNIVTAKVLVSHNANVNFQNEDGLSPLHISSENGEDELVDLLLEKGANVNALCDKGKGPVYYALKSVKSNQQPSVNKSLKCIYLLVKNGADFKSYVRFMFIYI